MHHSNITNHLTFSENDLHLITVILFFFFNFLNVLNVLKLKFHQTFRMRIVSNLDSNIIECYLKKVHVQKIIRFENLFCSKKKIL